MMRKLLLAATLSALTIGCASRSQDDWYKGSASLRTWENGDRVAIFADGTVKEKRLLGGVITHRPEERIQSIDFRDDGQRTIRYKDGSQKVETAGGGAKTL